MKRYPVTKGYLPGALSTPHCNPWHPGQHNSSIDHTCSETTNMENDMLKPRLAVVLSDLSFAPSEFSVLTQTSNMGWLYQRCVPISGQWVGQWQVSAPDGVQCSYCKIKHNRIPTRTIKCKHWLYDHAIWYVRSKAKLCYVAKLAFYQISVCRHANVRYLPTLHLTLHNWVLIQGFLDTVWSVPCVFTQSSPH